MRDPEESCPEDCPPRFARARLKRRTPRVAPSFWGLEGLARENRAPNLCAPVPLLAIGPLHLQGRDMGARRRGRKADGRWKHSQQRRRVSTAPSLVPHVGAGAALAAGTAARPLARVADTLRFARVTLKRRTPRVAPSFWGLEGLARENRAPNLCAPVPLLAIGPLHLQGRDMGARRRGRKADGRWKHSQQRRRVSTAPSLVPHVGAGAALAAGTAARPLARVAGDWGAHHVRGFVMFFLFFPLRE